MSFRNGVVKDFSGFSGQDIEPKSIDTIDIITETLEVTERAIINELTADTIDTGQLTVTGQIKTENTTTVDLNGNISINNQEYVLTIEGLENALAQAAITGGLSIFVAPGTFFVSKPLIVPKDTDIIGSGQNTTIFKARDSMNNDIFKLNGDNISIKELKIDGNGNNQSGNSNSNFILIANNIQNITLDSLNLVNGESQTDIRVFPPFFSGDTNWNTYIKLIHSANNVNILNCNIGPNVNNGKSRMGIGTIGIDLGNRNNLNLGEVSINDILIYGCNFNLMPKPIWGGRGGNDENQINNLLFQNNILTGTSNAIVDAYCYSFLLQGVTDSHISNNTFKNGVGFSFNGRNLTISNNMFNNSQGIFSEANNIVISNNIFDGPGGQTSSISCLGTNEIITNNKFSNCTSIATIVNTGTVNTPINTFVADNTVHNSRQQFYTGNSNFDDHDKVTIHKNQIIDSRILGNLAGPVDVSTVPLFSVGEITSNTSNTSVTFDNFFDKLHVSDTVDISDANISNVSISQFNILTQNGGTLSTTSHTEVDDVLLRINTFRQYTGYEDEVRLTTRNNIGLHEFTIPDIKPASFGHQIKFIVEDHGGSSPGDDVLLIPSSTGSNKQTFTAGPSAYSNITLNSSNEYCILVWNNSEWDLVRTNGTVA